MANESKDVYLDLRKRALMATRAEVGIASDDKSTWGILMEMGYPGVVVTLVSLSDGSASLYFSSGGGILGGVGHENVRATAMDFVRLANKYVSVMKSTNAFPLPQTGWTVFYVLTDSGVLAAQAEEMALGENRHPLSPLFYAGQEVLTQLRIVSEQAGA